MCRLVSFRFVTLGVALLLLSSSTAGAQDFVWAGQHGGGGTASGVDVDAVGNMYVVGSFNGTRDFDPGEGVELLTAKGSDAYVLKLDPEGNFLWVVRLGGNTRDSAADVVVGAEGNAYVAGAFTGTDAEFGDLRLDVEPPSSSCYGGSIDYCWDTFVCKLDPDGNVVWAVKGGGNHRDSALKMAIDSAGHVYTVGWFQSTVMYVDAGPDPNPRTELANHSSWVKDIFLWKVDSAGQTLWAVGLGSTSWDDGVHVATDDDDNVYVAGAFWGTVDFDPAAAPNPGATLASTGHADAFLLKLTAGADFVWVRRILGGSQDNSGAFVAVGEDGALYVGGSFYGTGWYSPPDPGPGFSFASIGFTDQFVMKTTHEGDLVWAHHIAGTGWESLFDAVLDDSGQLYVGGSFQSTTQFGSGPTLHGAGETDAFIWKLNGLDELGQSIWIDQLGAAGPDGVWDLETRGLADVYAAGHFDKTVDFDPGPDEYLLTCVEPIDAFALHLTELFPSTVFVTSTLTDGNLGGVAGADQQCTALAALAGLPSGPYNAWLSDSSGGPADRLVPAGPYVRVDGTPVADDLPDLTDGSLAAPINVTDTGQVLEGEGTRVWTGSSADGTPRDGNALCSDWTLGSYFARGSQGRPERTDATWSFSGASPCNRQRRLYCFQQPSPPDPGPVPGPRWIFVSSTQSSGNLGGLAGADATCNALAEAAGLDGAYKAWLADDVDSPNTRFSMNATGYFRPDSTLVAASYADLVGGSLLAPIEVTETGATVSTASSRVWTATTAYGDGLPANCSGWSTGSSLTRGANGQAHSTASTWSFSGAAPCDAQRRIYCVQQEEDPPEAARAPAAEKSKRSDRSTRRFE